MLAEYLELKKALLAAIKEADADLHRNLSMHALLQTDDPLRPFETRTVFPRGAEPESARPASERLFDRGFLDFGYQEVRDENNVEGVQYAPIEDLLADPACIGCAPVSLFDADQARVRMAHGMEEDDPEEDPDLVRMQLFVRLVQGSIVEGQPAERLAAEDAKSVCGLIFRYACGPGPRDCVVAFQRTQPMWVQQKSSLVLFSEDGPEMFSGQSVKIGNAFDFVGHDGVLFFRNLRALEVLFKYTRLSAQHAKDYADSLDGILADFEKLDERIDASRGVANKLLKLQRDGSPVAEMDPDDLRSAIGRLPYYNRKIAYSDEGKIMLTTNAQVSDFLKMLSDNFLVSPLTSARYESASKHLLDPDGL